MKITRLLATTGAIATMVVAALFTSPAPASAAPCGLSGHYGPTAPHVKIHTLYYTIRQCNGYTVRRELNIAGGLDSAKCHTISANSQVTGQYTMRKGSFARGIKPC